MTHEIREARDLDRAIVGALSRGEVSSPVARPRDLDALTGLLAAHADALREAVPPPPLAVVASRHSPRVLAATVAVAATLLVAIALRGMIAPLAPAPMPPAPAAMPMAMAMVPVSARMMGFPVGETHTAFPTMPPTIAVATPIIPVAPVAGTTRSHRVVAPGRADVPVRAAPDAAAPAVMTVFDGMAIEVVGERVTGAAGESWYPVQVGAVHGFLPAASLQPST